MRALLPTLAAVFGPDVIVSQHGADSHAWDPLAHLRVTTTAHGEAARLVDAVAHRWAGGRWLATGGGGYDAYRVVPRTWALTWLAGAHREPDVETPAAWRERWEAEAGAFGTPGMPATFLDEPNAGQPVGTPQVVADEASLGTLERVRRVALPALVREAEDRGWWRPSLSWAGRVCWRGRCLPAGMSPGASGVSGSPVVRALGVAGLSVLRIASRTIPPFDADDALALLRAAAADGARVVGAVSGDVLVGAAVPAPAAGAPGEESLLVVGVEPSHRGAGAWPRVAAGARRRPAGRRRQMRAAVGVAERDVVEPLDVARADRGRDAAPAGSGVRDRARCSPDVRRDDPWAIAAVLRPADRHRPTAMPRGGRIEEGGVGAVDVDPGDRGARPWPAFPERGDRISGPRRVGGGERRGRSANHVTCRLGVT